MKPYFRPGVGAVIYDTDGQILTFSRSDNGSIWQFPQGGIDPEESTGTTLWRELKEETGLTKNNFSNVTEYPDWTVYSYPKEVKSKLHYKNVLGQVHRWYFLEINDDTEVNLELAIDKEFSDYRWVYFSDFLEQNDKLKAHVYQELAEFFNKTILPNLK